MEPDAAAAISGTEELRSNDEEGLIQFLFILFDDLGIKRNLAF